MNWFPLPIFPEGGLASSVVTTVWVGVAVFSFMNLRFGWVFSGLVVPGYLAPLMIVKPWAAGVIVSEAVLTFGTVHAITKLMPRFKLACAFFGRDRFMAMILVSAVYRIIGDTWALPLLGAHLTSAYGIDFDYKNNLQSFGLIVICLAANQLWKTGIVKGAFPFAFNIVVTYLLVRYVLMEFTNFSIGNLGFLYEDIASSIYAAPKAYIVLITTSILASRMNLLYGWDFNGIMIPALIALQWYEPSKVLTSFVEALVILGTGILLLKLPLFKSVTVEGARKMLLFFSISFVYKMAIAWGLFFIAPEVKVTDLYGFGYLLPTLMAIKMHQLGRVVHQLRITAQISVVSVLVANVIGFSLTLLPSAGSATAGDRNPPDSRQFAESQLEECATRAFIEGHGAVGGGAATLSRPEDLYLFERGLDGLERYHSPDFSKASERIRRELGAAGFRIDLIGERYLLVAPADPASGRPFFILDGQSASELAVECPRPFEDRDTFDAALALFRDQGARLLAVAGAADSEGVRSFGDYGTLRSWLATIHRSFGRIGTIQVRRAAQGSQSRLYVKRALPEDLNLERLEARFGKFEARWESPPEENLLRDASRSGFCELFLDDTALIPAGPAVVIRELDEPIDSLIRRELYEFAPMATGLYRPPTAAELLHIDRHILHPLFSLPERAQEAQLTRIRHHASCYGFAVTAVREEGELYVLLDEPEPRRHWGSVLVRAGTASRPASSLCLEVPSRVQDRSLLSFAATQFKRLRARALIAAGTNALTNPDGSATLTILSNRDSIFNLAHQVFVRSAPSDEAVVLQCRAFLPAPGEPYPEADLILAAYHENRPPDKVHASLAPVTGLLRRDGAILAEVGEADDSSPYAVGLNPQAKYFDFADQGTFAILWLSPFLRESYRFQDENDVLLKMLKAVGIPIRQVPLTDYLSGRSFLPPGALNESLKSQLRDFRARSDLNILLNLPSESAPHAFEAILDPHSRQLFLACLEAEGPLHLVANLSEHAFDRSHPAGAGQAEAFADSRRAWMEGEVAP